MSPIIDMIVSRKGHSSHGYQRLQSPQPHLQEWRLPRPRRSEPAFRLSSVNYS